MNTDFGLTVTCLHDIQDILKKYERIKKAKIFGSRALGTYHANSDIDLVLFGDISNTTLAHIYEDLNELPYPYQFDLQIFNQITHPGLREHIMSFAKPL